MRKKIIAVLFTAVMALSICVGCSKSSNTDNVSTNSKTSPSSKIDSSTGSESSKIESSALEASNQEISMAEEASGSGAASIKFNKPDDMEVKVGYFGYNFLCIQGAEYDDLKDEIEIISTNPKVATIKSDGKSDNVIWCRIDAISAGTTTFYAQTKDGKLKTDKITVVVKEISKEEASRLAEESRKAEESQRAEESRLAEESRKAEESRLAEEKKNTLYNASGIKIMYKRISDHFDDKSIDLYIENNTLKDITVQVRDFSINGYMIDPIFSSDVAAGKKINDDIVISDSKLEKNDIEEIKDVELKFHIYNDDTGDTIIDTGVIKFSA